MFSAVTHLISPAFTKWSVAITTNPILKFFPVYTLKTRKNDICHFTLRHHINMIIVII